MRGFVEQRILGAVRGLLTDRVNSLLDDIAPNIPPIEFKASSGGNNTEPKIYLRSAETSEKERIILITAYTLEIAFDCVEERDCYAYAAVVDYALALDPTLGGIVNHGILTGRQYKPPVKGHWGGCWELVLTIRLVTEKIYFDPGAAYDR